MLLTSYPELRTTEDEAMTELSVGTETCTELLLVTSIVAETEDESTMTELLALE
jgi:hypothetical protein